MAIHVNRRKFIASLSGAAAGWPLAARAQRPSKIGVLSGLPENDPEGHARIAAFREALQKLGWMDGRNVSFDVSWAVPEVEAIQRLAKELVALRPDLIVTQNTPGTAAVLQHTRAIPTIFVNIVDPVGSGLVANFLRPGGNLTGFVSLEPTIVGKWLELLKQIAPRVARVAFLFNPATASYAEYLPHPIQFRCSIVRCGSDCGARSRLDRARNRHCFPGRKAQWWADNNAGFLSDHASRGDHRACCQSSAPRALSVPSIHRSRRSLVLWKRPAR